MADSREVMNIRQASQYLGVSPDTLYKYVYGKRFRLQAGEPLEIQEDHPGRLEWSARAPSAKAAARRSLGPLARSQGTEEERMGFIRWSKDDRRPGHWFQQ